MAQFKVGDVVKRVADRDFEPKVHKGDTGIVITLHKVLNNVEVKFFNGITCFNHEDFLVKVEKDEENGTES